MKFYIASSFRNIGNVRFVADQLKARGFTQTFDWTGHQAANSIAELAAIGQKEKMAVMDADLFIMMMPAGKGSHVELGIALASGKQIILYSPTDEINDPETTSTFYQLPAVKKVVGAPADLLSIVS